MTPKNFGLHPMAVAILAVSSVLSSYEALASQQDNPRPAISSSPERPAAPTLKAVESDHQKAIKSLARCIAMFTEINRYALTKEFPKHMLTDEQVTKLAGLLLQVRNQEARVKGAKVPVGLESQHAEMRRSLAEMRSEVAVTFSLVRQIRGTPEEFKGRVDMNAVKALADHSTQKLLEMART